MAAAVKGTNLHFDTIKQGKSLLKLKDGNYLEVILVVHKVMKTDQMNPAGEPIYGVQTSVALTLWKPEDIAKMEEE